MRSLAGLGENIAKSAFDAASGKSWYARYPLRGVGKAATGFSNLGVGAQRGIAYGAAGAAVGGIYGGASDNTSVLGGMARGAALGAGGGMASRGIQNMTGAYNVLRAPFKEGGFGMGRRQALAETFRTTGRDIGGYFGSVFGKPYNRIQSGLKKIGSYWPEDI